MNADETADKVARAMLAAEGTGPAWGIEIEEAREGYARLRMTLRPDMLNGHGTAHGGMVFALADTAFAYACNGRNVRSVAAQASIVYLEPARKDARHPVGPPRGCMGTGYEMCACMAGCCSSGVAGQFAPALQAAFRFGAFSGVHLPVCVVPSSRRLRQHVKTRGRGVQK